MGETFRRSGNPGYIIGLPVMAGTLVTNTDVGGTTRYAINVSSDNSEWLTMVAGGRCEEATSRLNRKSVLFGIGMRSSCYISLSYNNMSSVCNNVQQIVYNALRGTSNRIATFGNVSTEVVGDWIEILNYDDFRPAVPAGPGQCQNMLVGLDLEIVYANVGARNSPQPRIIGTRYNYKYQTNLYFQCTGQACQGSSVSPPTQNFAISSSVTFIDASRPPVAAYGQVPQTSARLPEDFFYPFV
jgi:tectonic-1/3